MLLELSEATAARRRVPFVLVDDTDGKTPETGVTFSAGEIKVSKNGGAEANHAGTVTELASGDYYYEATAGELDTVGALTIKFAKSGCRTFRALCQVVAFDPYNAQSLGLSGLPDADAGAAGGLFVLGANAGNVSFTGTMTLAGAVTLGDGLTVVNADGIGITVIAGGGPAAAFSSSNTHGVTITSHVDAHGLAIHGGLYGIKIDVANPLGVGAWADGGLDGGAGLELSGHTHATLAGSVALRLSHFGPGPGYAYDADGGALLCQSMGGDILGKILGGGASAITGTGVRAVDASGNPIAPAATALSNAVWTDVRAALMDLIDVAVSTRLAAAGYTAPPSAGAVADAICDEALSGHSTPGTVGAALSDAAEGAGGDTVSITSRDTPA